MALHQAFSDLHKKGDPLVLYNVWDAGSALAVLGAGAKAIATGSASLAGAQGFKDGEGIPLDALLITVRQINAVVDCPLSVDFETGYSNSLDELEDNARALFAAGAVACNLEDRLLGEDSLRSASAQAERIAVLHKAGLFVNARTDLFLGPLVRGENTNQIELVDAAVERAGLYAKAGAGSFFAPGLSDPDLIKGLCERVDVPVNIMRLPGMVSNVVLASLGVARISYGPGPWREAMDRLEAAARAEFSA